MTEQTTRYYVDANGNYLGGFAGAEPPAGSVEVPAPPQDARQIWSGGVWGAIPVTLADVTPRQIRLALTQVGLRTMVEEYVAGASQDVKDSWEFSISFERNHPFILDCAAALNKTDAEIDALFTLAATL